MEEKILSNLKKKDEFIGLEDKPVVLPPCPAERNLYYSI